MKHVPFDPTTLTGDQLAWWTKWSKAAAAAKAQAKTDIAAGRKPKLKPRIWSLLKVWLLANVFHERCAYCETRISPGAFGEGEHYRPKGNVRDGDRKPVSRPTGEPHGGYYWLAYEWENLLPACDKCNNAKVDIFPVRKTYSFDDSLPLRDLDMAEEPLLLNPYFDEPAKHLVFGAAGTVVARGNDPRGEFTIRVFGLDRPELSNDRDRALRNAKNAGQLALSRLLDGEPLAGFWEEYAGAKSNYPGVVGSVMRERLRQAIAAELQKMPAGD
jgi:hypothetical protein